MLVTRQSVARPEQGGPVGRGQRQMRRVRALARGSRICRWGAVGNRTPGPSVCQFRQAATDLGGRAGDAGELAWIAAVRAAFVAKRRIPEDGGAAWCNGGAFGLSEPPANTKDKDRVGRLWAAATGNVYATVFKA